MTQRDSQPAGVGCGDEHGKAPGPAATDAAGSLQPTPGHIQWCWLLLAVIWLVGWFLLLNLRHDHRLGDERVYLPTIIELTRGDRSTLYTHSITPTYLLMVAAVAKVLGPSLWVVRGVTLAFGIVAAGAALSAAAALWPQQQAQRLFLVLLNPIPLVFWTIGYSDVPALAGLLIALAAMLRGWHIVAAVGLLLACVMRQSNLVWVVGFAVLAVHRCVLHHGTDAHVLWRAPRRLVPLIRQVLWPYVAVGIVLLGLIQTSWLRVLPHPVNGPAFNRAQVYMFLLVAAVLWVPYWLPHVHTFWRRSVRGWLMSPAGSGLAVALVALLALAYTNPHSYNRELYFLRNYVLVAIAESPALHVVVAMIIVAFAATYAYATRQTQNWRTLLIIWIFSALFLGPHYLVDPRYYMPIFVLLDLFTPYANVTLRRQLVWYALLSAGLAGLVLVPPGAKMP